MRFLASTLMIGLMGMALPIAAAHAQATAPVTQADWHGGWHHHGPDGWHGYGHHWHHWHHYWRPAPPPPYGYYAPAVPNGGYVYGYVYH